MDELLSSDATMSGAWLVTFVARITISKSQRSLGRGFKTPLELRLDSGEGPPGSGRRNMLRPSH